jgi:dihydrofolate reductase
MADLIYSAITSLDGFTADADGNFDWAAPSDEVHAFVNDRERPIGTYLYGRRMYDTMVYWETASTGEDVPLVAADFARLWQAADKIVYSQTLPAPASRRTELAREFDVGAVERLKAAADRDVGIGGPTLAAQAIAANLVDEYHFYVNPVVVGGGTRALPDLPPGLRLDLELVDDHRFTNGVIYLRYRNR